jgi:U4/U6 small nuclear ribonucleoprotein PRP31
MSSTLADALLDDLDDLSDNNYEDGAEEEEEEKPDANDDGEDNRHNRDRGGDPDDDEFTTAAWWPNPHQKPLLNDPTLHKHLQAIRIYMEMHAHDDAEKKMDAGIGGGGSSNANREQQQSKQQQQQNERSHKLLVQSNQYLLQSGLDLHTAHAALCAAYRSKFPELEELVPDPTQYVRAVRCLGNHMDAVVTASTAATARASSSTSAAGGDDNNVAVNDGLNTFLSSHQIITLSVAESTTAGRPLSTEEMQVVDDIASYMEQDLEIRQLLTDFLKHQMEDLAPSVCALIGPSTAAKLFALTGGLEALSKIPSCNLQVLGQVKQHHHHRSGISRQVVAVQQQPHQGILIETDLVQRCPRHMRTRAVKMVAAKLALAIRCDATNAATGRARSADAGRAFRQQIEEKFVKLQEPDKAPVLKALPK